MSEGTQSAHPYIVPKGNRALQLHADIAATQTSIHAMAFIDKL